MENLPTSLIYILRLLHPLKFLLPLVILLIDPILLSLQKSLLVLHELGRRSLPSPRVGPLLPDLWGEGALSHLILLSLLIYVVLVLLQILIPCSLLVDESVGHLVLRSNSGKFAVDAASQLCHAVLVHVEGAPVFHHILVQRLLRVFLTHHPAEKLIVRPLSFLILQRRETPDRKYLLGSTVGGSMREVIVNVIRIEWRASTASLLHLWLRRVRLRLAVVMRVHDRGPESSVDYTLVLVGRRIPLFVDITDLQYFHSPVVTPVELPPGVQGVVVVVR